MLTHKKAVLDDYPKVLEVWGKSVKETHNFLSQKDFVFYQEAIPNYLNAVELLLWYDDEQLLGFSGTQDEELAMLFLNPEFMGKKYGSKILVWLLENKNIQKIDVNAQNKNAKAFYLKHGFTIDSENQIDGFGKNYPILHLVKQSENEKEGVYK